MAEPLRKPKPETRLSESKDPRTGYRTITHDLDVPGRQSHEPSGIRAQAKETGKNRWLIQVHHGPHETRDETGSYYKNVGLMTHEGTLGSVKPMLKRLVGEQWKGLRP